MLKSRELDSRNSNGIHVRLFWNPQDEGLEVAVADTRTGESHVIAITNPKNAVEVFNHPFAYLR